MIEDGGARVRGLAHSKRHFLCERVGSCPLEAVFFVRTSGVPPTRSPLFCYLSGYTPFAKIPFNYIKCNKRPVASLWQNFLPPRNLIFHPIKGFLPTRNGIYYRNEWGPAHSKQHLPSKRVGRDPLEIAILSRTSGAKPSRSCVSPEEAMPKAGSSPAGSVQSCDLNNITIF